MGNHKKIEGQTLVETAFILVLLLLIVLGIAEFARAWFMKSSLKNAVRQGVRVAVVTTDKSKIIAANGSNCNTVASCPYTSNEIINAVCCQPGVPRTGTGTSLTVTCSPSSCGGVSSGETITVTASYTGFKTIVPKLLGSFIPSTLSADASMRYE